MSKDFGITLINPGHQDPESEAPALLAFLARDDGAPSGHWSEHLSDADRMTEADAIRLAEMWNDYLATKGYTDRAKPVRLSDVHPITNHAQKEA